MDVRLHDDVATFAELSLPLLYADPVRHTVAITVLAERLRAGGPDDMAQMITVHERSAVRGVAMQVKGWPLIASALPAELAPAVADVLVERDPDLAGVSGPRPEADAFASAWHARTGRGGQGGQGGRGGQGRQGGMDQRLFVLEQLTPPVAVPGAPRVATLDDVELLTEWRYEFARAALPESWPRADVDAIARLIRTGHGNVLWELDREPVALAAASVPMAGMSRIGPVWTPPEHRNRGFGSAVTAAASRWALDAGAVHVVLFTNLANPVSNAIYPRIGYRPVFDAVEFGFQR